LEVCSTLRDYGTAIGELVFFSTLELVSGNTALGAA
jgi:hypothetical protein